MSQACSPGGYFQRLLVRDSDNFVKPFMHVVIQATRHYAHIICYLNIAIKFGLYLNKNPKLSQICLRQDLTFNYLLIKYLLQIYLKISLSTL